MFVKYVDMHIVRSKFKPASGKVYETILLRESYREGKKVKKRTVANLTNCSPQEIAAIELALKHKDDLTILTSRSKPMVTEGLSIGSVWVVYEAAKRLGIMDALGSKRQGQLALWQVIARVLEQGSRLSTVRLAETYAIAPAIGLEQGFNEEDLYKNLFWLSQNQVSIEDKLFALKSKNSPPNLFLYDGCYVLKTDLTSKEASTQAVHNRYKDLALVESAFRTVKSDLEIRPVYLRNEENTRAHVLIVMLAYMIIRELDNAWKNLYLTVEEGLRSLSTLTMLEVSFGEEKAFQQIPEPREQNKRLLEAANVKLPKVLPKNHALVVTRQARRKSAKKIKNQQLRCSRSP